MLEIRFVEFAIVRYLSTGHHRLIKNPEHCLVYFERLQSHNKIERELGTLGRETRVTGGLDTNYRVLMPPNHNPVNQFWEVVDCTIDIMNV